MGMSIKKNKLTELNPVWLYGKTGLEVDCPCGCDARVYIPFKNHGGHVWQHDEKEFNELTITPSIQRTSGCKTHFSIINGNVVP